MTVPETSLQRESGSLTPFANVMKRDWDQRARENARWYINTLRLDQSEEEFDRSGERDVAGLVGSDLPLLCDWRASTDLRLLEIGCGIGRMSRHLAPLFQEVVSIDVSGEMIRQARARLAEVPNLHFHETSGVDLALFRMRASMSSSVPMSSNTCRVQRRSRRICGRLSGYFAPGVSSSSSPMESTSLPPLRKKILAKTLGQVPPFPRNRYVGSPFRWVRRSSESLETEHSTAGPCCANEHLTKLRRG